MKFVISIVNPDALGTLHDVCRSLEVPIFFDLFGRGTAARRTLDLLGIESRQRRIVICLADDKKTEKLIDRQRRYLGMDAPGHGIVLAVPIKSIGGRKTMANLCNPDSPEAMGAVRPEDCRHELIFAIANEGYIDIVMDAAREAGAGGGTVLHGKGTASEAADKFFGISVAQEKELVMIVADTEKKADIMRSVLRLAGPTTDAGAIVFSLPVSDIGGFGAANAADESEK